MALIALERYRLEQSPHLAGEARCLSCLHEWTAVTPVGTFRDLECPACGLAKGVLKYGVVPERVWTCNCGCDLFCLSGISMKMLCYQCGRVHEVE